MLSKGINLSQQSETTWEVKSQSNIQAVYHVKKQTGQRCSCMHVHFVHLSVHSADDEDSQQLDLIHKGTDDCSTTTVIPSLKQLCTNPSTIEIQKQEVVDKANEIITFATSTEGVHSLRAAAKHLSCAINIIKST